MPRTHALLALVFFVAQISCSSPDGSSGAGDGSHCDAASAPCPEGDGGAITNADGAGASQGDSAAAGDGAIVPQVDVAHAREVRGVWLATVSNIDWPSRTGLAPNDAKKELSNTLDALSALGVNTVHFQIRPESDALYASSLEPWSRYLTGTQGGDPGWDPLAYAITEAHARGIELHAWINPYRAAANKSSPLAATHIANTLSPYAYAYGSAIVMDPGAKPVRDHVVSVVLDVVNRYDVDGIVFDDYFYPYPISGAPFPDDGLYDAYVSGGGKLGKSDWRRSNVNALIQEVSEGIAKAKPHVRFGISPFGIWRPNNPPGVKGLDAYEALGADALAWLDGGWIDYVGPQLYWTTTSSGQPFKDLLAWWTGEAHKRGRYDVPSLDASSAGKSGWSLDEYRAQLGAIRDANGANGARAMGATFFSTRQLVADQAGLASMLKSEIWTSPAIPPPLSIAASATFATPHVSVTAGTAHATHAETSVRGYLLYERKGAEWTVAKWSRGAAADFAITKGSWAISAVDARDVESHGVPITSP